MTDGPTPDGPTPDGPTPDERRATSDRLWVPDNADGSGWADVDWASAAQGSRYHYQHGPPIAAARAARPGWFRVRTRLESDELRPHENDYYVAAADLGDFVAEMVLTGGAEIVWHIEPCPDPPAEARVRP